MELSSYTVDPTLAYGWKSTTKVSAGLGLGLLNASADAFGPLKSAVGFLSAIVDNYEVQYTYLVKPFTPLTFEPANEVESRSDKFVNTPD